METALGRIEVVDLRSVWSSEALDFTPWLAEPENIAFLGAVLGLDLEVAAQEKRVGRFSADILCKDVATDTWVLIENQLERSDHGHLGQLLTYAAGLETVTIVWIARHFCDEHRAALTWLNSITDDKFRFFGVQVEVWRVSGSLPAPRFAIAVAPNDWNRSVRKATTQITRAQSDGAARRLEYWLTFLAAVRLDHQGVRLPTANTLGNLRFDLKGRDLWITVYNAASLGRIGVFLRGSAELRDLLFRHRNDIKPALGQEATWEDGDRWCVAVSIDADPGDRTDWPDQHKWLGAHLNAFLRVFLPYAVDAPNELQVR